MRFSFVIVFPICVVLDAEVVHGQNFPTKPLRIVTGTVGGGNDFTARQLAEGLAGPLGQPVIVDNRGSAILGADAVSKAPPDGYTLTAQGVGLWISPLLQKTPYDAVKDFLPVALTDRSVNIVAVHPSLPAHSVKQLIALAKARPGELNYGSAGGQGGTSHLAAELFKSMAGVNILWVPYKGTAPTIAALISGEVQLTIADVRSVLPYAKTGRLRALAVTSAEPSTLAPALPTVAASGLPGYEATGVSGILAPAKTATGIINRLNLEILRFLSKPEVKERFLKSGTEVVGSSPEEFATVIGTDIARLGKLIKDAGIRVE